MMMGTNKPVQLISGYRSLETNKLRSKSSVWRKSYHTRGQAMDLLLKVYS